MLWAFKLDSLAKMALDRALPQLAENPDSLGQYGGEIDRVSEAQLMALRNVLERRQ